MFVRNVGKCLTFIKCLITADLYIELVSVGGGAWGSVVVKALRY